MYCLALQALELAPDMLTTLLEAGACESLVKVVQGLSEAPTQPTDLGGDENDILWRDVEALLQLVASRAFL